MTEQNRENLIRRFKKEGGQELRNEVILAYAPVVKIIAGSLYAKNGNPIFEKGDYESFGIFGLIDAIDKYDINMPNKFETYASLRIRGAILDELRRNDHVSRSTRDKQKAFEDLKTRAIEKFGANYSTEQIIEISGMNFDEFCKFEREAIVPVNLSLDSILGIGDDDTTQHFDIKDERTSFDGENEVLRKELAEKLRLAIEALTEKEQQVITLIYYEDLTLAECGIILEVSESRISQLRSKALLKMRDKLQKYVCA